MRVLLINDGTGSPNWGDRAAGLALRMMISETGGEIIHAISEDDLYISALDGSDGSSEASGSINRERIKRLVPPLLLQIRRSLLPNVDRTRESTYIPGRWEEYEKCGARFLLKSTPWPKLVHAIEGMDVAVINGTGAIKGNRILPRTLFFLGYMIKRHFGKPVIMVNHAADLDHPDLRRVAEEVYPLFDDVVFRDWISLDRCAALCPGRFGADTSFWFEPVSREIWEPLSRRPGYFDFWPDEARFDPLEPYLCVGGSSILGKAQDLGEAARGFAALAAQLQSRYPGQVIMTASDTIDQKVFRPIARKLSLPLIGLPTPVQQAFDILGNADAYVGGRWHPGIFALRGGAPVVGISAKTFKMQALAEMAGLPFDGFDALELGREAGTISQRLLSLLEMGGDLRRSLRSWAQAMAETSWENVAYLHKLRERGKRANGFPEAP